jgi:hypothetical protein
MHIARLPAGSIMKSDMATELMSSHGPGASGYAELAQAIPNEWALATYGPGQPFIPLTRGEDTIMPRAIDYPIAVNTTINPRTNYGLMPFVSMVEAYDAVTEVSMDIHLLISILSSFRPRFIAAEGKHKGDEVMDHDMQWMLETPDGVTPYVEWLGRFLQSVLVCDAGCQFVQEDHGNLAGLRYVDGSTIFLLIDEFGQIPLPKQKSTNETTLTKYYKTLSEWLQKGKTAPRTTPAYTQVIKGTPFGWYDQDQLWYRPMFKRMNAPYGRPGLEMAWSQVMVLANITSFELAHYRTGNMPEGFMNAPDGWSFEKSSRFETLLNARMSSGPAERNRIRVFPAGFKYTPMKKPDFPKMLYEQARDNLCLAYGIPPQEVGKQQPGSSLGGKGVAELMQMALFRDGILPIKSYTEAVFNEIFRRYGIDDVNTELSIESQSVDPDKMRESVVKLFSAGLLSMNSALAQLGEDPVEGGEVRLVIQGGTVIVIDDYLEKRIKGELEQGDPGVAKQPGENPEPGVANEQPPDKKDADQTMELARQILAGKKVPTNKNGTQTTVSVPSTKTDGIVKGLIGPSVDTEPKYGQTMPGTPVAELGLDQPSHKIVDVTKDTDNPNGGSTIPLFLKVGDCLNMDKAELVKLVKEFGVSHSDVLALPNMYLKADLDREAGVLTLEIIRS